LGEHIEFPVLCPQLSYERLAIKEGATASQQWWEMVSGERDPEKRLEITEALRKYCKLDTYAMYAIWRVLQDHCFDRGTLSGRAVTEPLILVTHLPDLIRRITESLCKNAQGTPEPRELEVISH
jgi:hypothetical protein